MRILVNLREFLKKIVCSNCCSTNNNTFEDRNLCQCEMCENFQPYDIDEDSYLGLDDENLYPKKKHECRQKIHGRVRRR